MTRSLSLTYFTDWILFKSKKMLCIGLGKLVGICSKFPASFAPMIKQKPYWYVVLFFLLLPNSSYSLIIYSGSSPKKLGYVEKCFRLWSKFKIITQKKYFRLNLKLYINALKKTLYWSQSILQSWEGGKRKSQIPFLLFIYFHWKNNVCYFPMAAVALVFDPRREILLPFLKKRPHPSYKIPSYSLHITF